MRSIFAVVLLLAVGCSNEGSGAPAPEAAPVAIWADATGAVVSPASSGPAVYFDPAGHIWAIDHETAKLTPTTSLSYLFSDSGCSKPAYISGPIQPRATFSTPDGRLYVRPDAAQMAPLAASAAFEGTPARCQPVQANEPAVLSLGVAVAVTTPATAFAPPLHQELR